jgi:hypothetical protein
MTEANDAGQDREDRPYLWISIGAFVGLVFLTMAFSPWGELPGKDFYAIAAQVIPVLLVALAIDTSTEDHSRFPKWGYELVFTMLVDGEVIAFVALSGTFAADSQTYRAVADDTWLGNPIFEEPDIDRVIKEGPLVGGSFLASLVFATLTSLALVSALVGVVLRAAFRAVAPRK